MTAITTILAPQNQIAIKQVKLSSDVIQKGVLDTAKN